MFYQPESTCKKYKEHELISLFTVSVVDCVIGRIDGEPGNTFVSMPNCKRTKQENKEKTHTQ